ncbi:MAG TPA: hypothetical protein VFS40_05985 [Gemmatimonadales bacterium]|nr:hypothetical protein [Gemmatimonadales bacterium]
MRAVQRTAVALALAWTAAALGPARAAAQRPERQPRGEREGIVEVGGRDGRGERHGFWLSLGLGTGAEQYAVQPELDRYSDTYTQPVVSLALGGTLGRHWRLGGEVQSWFSTENGETQSLASFLGIVQFYPFARQGLFLKGGVGLARNGLTDVYGYDYADAGFAAALGAGWEIPLSRRFFLTPLVEVVGQNYQRRDAPDYRERIVHVGVGIGLQP